MFKRERRRRLLEDKHAPHPGFSSKNTLRFPATLKSGVIYGYLSHVSLDKIKNHNLSVSRAEVGYIIPNFCFLL